MKIKIVWWSVMLLIGSHYFINYKLASVGVPTGILLAFGLFYGMFWPLKLMEEIKEDNKDDGKNKTDTLD